MALSEKGTKIPRKQHLKRSASAGTSAVPRPKMGAKKDTPDVSCNTPILGATVFTTGDWNGMAESSPSRSAVFSFSGESHLKNRRRHNSPAPSSSRSPGRTAIMLHDGEQKCKKNFCPVLTARVVSPAGRGPAPAPTVPAAPSRPGSPHGGLPSRPSSA